MPYNITGTSFPVHLPSLPG